MGAPDIQAPDFGKIEKEVGNATANALKLIWYNLNQEGSFRRINLKASRDAEQLRVLSAAPASNQDNFVADGYGVISFTGGTAFNLTGLANGAEGRRIHIHNTGAGTVTLKHNVTSDATNRLFLSTGADKSLVTGTSTIFVHAAGAWREFKGL